MLRSQKVPPELGGELGEEYGIVGEDWDCNGMEMELGRRKQERGEQK